MTTTTTPVIENLRSEFKAVIIQLDIAGDLAVPCNDWVHCNLAGVQVEIKGVVVSTKLDYEFAPLKVTDNTGRYSFIAYCEKMGWNSELTRTNLQKAYSEEMHW